MRAPGQIVGVGAGQMSRVDSVKLGAMKAVLPLAGTVVASDAFFPFPDGVEEAVKNGATAFIQPGGSVRDAGRDRRRRPAGRRHGLHRRPPFPPLTNGSSGKPSASPARANARARSRWARWS